MIKKLYLIFALLLAVIAVFCQKPSIELTFTAVSNDTWIPLDSIRIINRTQGGDTVIYWPDTVLVIDYQVIVPELDPGSSGFQLIQNYPNPVKNQTVISLFVPEKGLVDFSITDLSGREVIRNSMMCEAGFHSFRFTPGLLNCYVLSAKWRDNTGGIKMLNLSGHVHQNCTFQYIGNEKPPMKLKTSGVISRFGYNPSDVLLFAGYSNSLQSGIPDSPENPKTYIFQFAYNIPCPGTPTITYEGQIYNTIQIFSQCWIKENLNAGSMIPGMQEMEDNGIPEKYCYANDPANCDVYGGLYQWNEAMQYDAGNPQGICPSDWHVPSDEEWKVLEGAVDHEYGIGNVVWDDPGYRGYDAGINLKSAEGWGGGGNGNDHFGFKGLPGGNRLYDGFFDNIGYNGYWWSTTEYEVYFSWIRGLSHMSQNTYRGNDGKSGGFSVRCIKDQ